MNTSVDVSALNKAIQGFTEILRFDLAATDGTFSLALTLGDDASRQITLVFRDVQNLELNPAGNGFEQVLRLQIEDMQDDGLDRVRFSVEELEHETLFLHCADVQIKKVQG